MCLLQILLGWSLGWDRTVPSILNQDVAAAAAAVMEALESGSFVQFLLACTAGSVEQQRQWLEQEAAAECTSHPLMEAARRRQGESAFAQDDLARQVGARLHEVQQVRALVCLLEKGVNVLRSRLKCICSGDHAMQAEVQQARHCCLWWASRAHTKMLHRVECLACSSADSQTMQPEAPQLQWRLCWGCYAFVCIN